MTTTTDLAEFALRTKDKAWIERHHGWIEDGGKVIVKIPADEIEFLTWQLPPGQQRVLRHAFRDCPRDFPNPVVVCFATWVPETEARFAGRFRQEGGNLPAQPGKGRRARQAR